MAAGLMQGDMQWEMHIWMQTGMLFLHLCSDYNRCKDDYSPCHTVVVINDILSVIMRKICQWGLMHFLWVLQ